MKPGFIALTPNTIGNLNQNIFYIRITYSLCVMWRTFSFSMGVFLKFIHFQLIIISWLQMTNPSTTRFLPANVKVWIFIHFINIRWLQLWTCPIGKISRGRSNKYKQLYIQFTTKNFKSIQKILWLLSQIFYISFINFLHRTSFSSVFFPIFPQDVLQSSIYPHQK